MSGKIKPILLTLSAIWLLFLPELQATHIVGGDMTYRCLGNNFFEISLTFTRDCEYGADDALFDEFALVAIYDQYYNPVSLGANGLIAIPYTGADTINTSLENNCEIMGYEVCVHQSVYRDTVFLLPKSGGYILSYQRCCRNSTLLNIKDPLETGATQTLRITEDAFDMCNSSPVFNHWPDIYICTDRPIDFDHSATDPDGDSLVYKLWTPLQGAGVDNPRPDRFAEFDVPYKQLEWANGFTENNMLGGTPLHIDPQTGFITGVPNRAGQFVVGVMVEEYRDGKLLSTVRRDFEYNVRVCLDPPEADFEAPSVLCGSDEFTVAFINTSQFADSYFWQFDYPSLLGSRTSTDENPVYTYPNNPAFDGKDTFQVYLKAIRSMDQCFDEIIKEILVIEDELVADFEFQLLGCPGDSIDIYLKDISVPLNPSYTIDSWTWTITLEDGSVVTGTGPEFYTTVLRQNAIGIVLEIGSIEGCLASTARTETLEYVELSFIADPVAICKGDSTRLVANPNAIWTYLWDPEDGLYFEDPSDKSNPWCSIDHDITYYVTVTDGICDLQDSVHVLVQDYLDIGIDGPDYVCNDTITLIALGGEPGITVFEWAESDSFDPVIAEGDTVSFYINGWEKEYFLRVKEGTGCSIEIDSFYAFNNAIDLSYDKVIEYCFGMEMDIVISNNRPQDTLFFTWEPSPYIITPLDSNIVTIYSDQAGSFDIIFHVVNQFGCEWSDIITINSNEGPSLTMTAEFECDTYRYCFEAFGGEGADYHWDFGVEGDETDVSSEVSPCFDYPGPGIYTVTVTAFFAECSHEITLTKEIEVPEFFELIGKDSLVYCEGESVMLSVNPSNFSPDIKWYDESGNQIGSGIMIEYTPNGDETILVIGVDTFGCMDSLLMFLDQFEFDVSKDNPDVLCEGDTITISVYNNTTDLLSYQWEANPTIVSPLDDSSITVLLADDESYVVTITSVEYGCTLVESIDVTVSSVDIEITTDTSIIVLTKSTELTVVGDYDPAISTIQWSTGESTEAITDLVSSSVMIFGVGIMYQSGDFLFAGGPAFASVGQTQPAVDNFSPELTTIYCVTVTDIYGCSDEDCLEVTVIDPACDETDIYIPNVFSPNDDDDIPDNNDIFRPRGKYLEEVEIVIFNRWGEEIFQVKGDPDVHWDGRYKGEFLGPDAFAYIIRIVCQDTETFEAIGNVSIVK